MPQKTFLITGVSSGLGAAIARRALAAGHRVAGTVRSEADRQAFETTENARGYLLDVTDEQAIKPTVEQIGPIDVLVVNAGYGHEGTMEESTLQDLRRQFEVNVFGAVGTIKAVLPGMRERRRGNILIITSMGGMVAFPGISFYNGSKFAMEGIAESLAQEVAPFDVHVTAVAPGSFRTDWSGRSMVRAPRSIPDYDELFDPIRATRQESSGRQLGDPDRAGDAVLALIEAEKPPVHLVLGSDALRIVAAGRQRVQDDLENWAELSRSTDHADGGATLG
jgi:NAD(P)-dependent dehydrogenase (short-subunit alcohol dehydrogenase family)